MASAGGVVTQPSKATANGTTVPLRARCRFHPGTLSLLGIAAQAAALIALQVRPGHTPVARWGRRRVGRLGIADASVVKSYGSRLPTRHEHAREIAGVVGYRDFSAAEVELRAWLEARLWAMPERPGVSFDRATAWLVERRVLLPGATVLARLVTSAREATTERSLLSLGGRMSPDQTVGLEMLLVVEAAGLPVEVFEAAGGHIDLVAGDRR
jgi:hypothetical protein